MKNLLFRFGGVGTTVIDSLSTLMLMNLTEEVAAGREFIKAIDFKKDVSVKSAEIFYVLAHSSARCPFRYSRPSFAMWVV
jgi:hypothetical protein